MDHSQFCRPVIPEFFIDQWTNFIAKELTSVPENDRGTILSRFAQEILRKYAEILPAGSEGSVAFPEHSSICWNPAKETDDPYQTDTRYAFRIKKKIGQGGFSEIFQATDLSLNRDVAIKILLREAAEDPDLRRNFIREILQTARLEHNNIIRIYSLNQDAQRHYTSMEYIDGVDLREAVISVRQFNLPVIRNLFIQVCSALQYIHKKGFIHCDLKPENVLVNKDGIAKLIDFNLMRSKNTLESEAPKYIMGTPAYLAPELIEERRFDERADIYALGVMFYEMRTGVAPFEGTVNEMLHHHLLTTPKPPSRRAAGILPEEDRIIMKCLAKNPQDRYSTVTELIADMKSIENAEKNGSKQSSISPCSIMTNAQCSKNIEMHRSMIPLINAIGTKANIMFEENAEIAVRSLNFEPVRLGRELTSLNDLCQYCQITTSSRAVICNVNAFSPLLALQIGLAFGNQKRTLLVKGNCFDTTTSFLEQMFQVHPYSDDKALAKLISHFIRSHDEDIKNTSGCFFRWPYHCKKRPSYLRKDMLFLAVPALDDKEKMLMNQAVLPGLSQMGFEPIVLSFESRNNNSTQAYYQDLCTVCRGALTARAALVDISQFDDFTAFILGVFIGSKKKLLLIRRSGSVPHPVLGQLSQFQISFFKEIIDAVHENIL